MGVSKTFALRQTLPTVDDAVAQWQQERGAAQRSNCTGQDDHSDR